MVQQLNKAKQLALTGNYPNPRLDLRECKTLATAEQYAPAVPANWSPAPTAQDAALDQLAATTAAAGSAATALAATVAAGPQVTVVVYDFAVNGGAVGTIPLTGFSLPSGAVIQSVTREVVTAPTSTASTGTILLGVPVENALVAAAITADGAAASAKSVGSTAFQRLAAARVPQVTIATNAVLSGKVRWYVQWVPGSAL